MRYILFVFFVLFSVLESKSVIIKNKSKVDIYSLSEYKEKIISSTKHKPKGVIDFGISLDNLKLLSSKENNLTLGKDYYKKCTIMVDSYDSNKTLKSMFLDGIILDRKGVREDNSKVGEIVINKNRAIVSFYGSDKGGVWSTIKYIVKFNKHMDIYEIDSTVGCFAPVAPLAK